MIPEYSALDVPKGSFLMTCRQKFVRDLSELRKKLMSRLHAANISRAESASAIMMMKYPCELWTAPVRADVGR